MTSAIILTAAIDHELAAFEMSMRILQSNDEIGERDARAKLRIWLSHQINQSEIEGSIPDMIAKLSLTPHQHSSAAIIILRALDHDGVVPEGTGSNNSGRHIVELCERAIPDLCHFVGLEAKSQTYEKIGKLKGVHKKICNLLSPLREEYTTIQGFCAGRQTVLGSLNHGRVRRYCEPYKIADLRGNVEAIIQRMSRVLQLEPSLLLDVDECRRSIAEGQQIIRECPSFLTLDFFEPFVMTAECRLDEFLASTRGRFLTNIVPGFSSIELQKRYPLHEEGRELNLVVPLRNIGPGLATDVRVTIVSESADIAFDDQSISLGHVSPGDFSVSLGFLVIKGTDSFNAIIEVDWGELATSERKSDFFNVVVVAQRADIDWDSLEYFYPYSTSPAKGDGFVGRSEQIRTLVSRMLRRPMEPTFIAGQKRVGKTSLAIAAMEAASEYDPDKSLSHLYILWGEIAHENPRTSLALLGSQIEEFMLSEIGNPPYAGSSYAGTLAPLIKLAGFAAKMEPKRRFVITIDEFDEIPQELFLQGNLAETLFANLRALTTTSNMCIVLVGGENMPFVMERQGQKLNKYAGVNVTYFSRLTEWEDYRTLVRRPTAGTIVWHDDAVNQVFFESNGNPYFTKVICGEALATAVRERDADITAAEINRAIDTRVSGLDANLFAHLWQDGISKSSVEREPVVLQRSRVLVALARCYRKRLRPDLNNIGDARGGLQLTHGEMTSVLNDFVRRGVLTETDGTYEPVLPIFKRWLIEAGINRLIADSVTEELAAVAQKLEDDAHVGSAEIAQLSARWPTYRGRQIGTDDIRAWLNQVDTNRKQRMLFTLLENVRFLSDVDIRQRLKSAHFTTRSYLPEFVRRKTSDRRTDIVVSYVDGEGKSGQHYASLYCDENKLQTSAIISPHNFASSLAAYQAENGKTSVVVIVDDIAATGRQLMGNIRSFIEANSAVFDEEGPTLVATCLLATEDAEQLIRRGIAKLDYPRIDFRAGELLHGAAAFGGETGVFSSVDDMEAAKSLARDLGARIYRHNPLGFGDLGLLIVFPTTVPNNSLPILHSMSKSSNDKWHPLFPRPVS